MQVIMMEIAACLEMKISSADYTFGGWYCKRDKRISELAMLFELASLCTQSTEQTIQTTYLLILSDITRRSSSTEYCGTNKTNYH